MPFYVFDRGSTPLGRTLAAGLDGLRAALTNLARVNADMAQMTDQQIADEFVVKAVTAGNTAVQQAAALKAEMSADVGKILTDASQSGVFSALNQLLAQTG